MPGRAWTAHRTRGKTTGWYSATASKTLKVTASADWSGDKKLCHRGRAGKRERAGGYRSWTRAPAAGRQLWVEAKDLRFNEEETDLEEYQSKPAPAGLKLLEHQPIQNSKVDVTAGTFQYLRDFDLGDKVDDGGAGAGPCHGGADRFGAGGV